MRKTTYLLPILTITLCLTTLMTGCKNQCDDLSTPTLSESVVEDARTADNTSELSKPSVSPYEADENFYAKFIDVSRFEELCASVEASSDYVANESQITFQSNRLWNEMLEEQGYSLPSDSDIEAELERLYGELSRVAEENGVSEEELVDCYGITEDEFTMFVQQQVLDATEDAAD